MTRRRLAALGVDAALTAATGSIAGCADPAQRPVVVCFGAGIDPATVTFVELTLIEGGCGLQPVPTGGDPMMALKTIRVRPGAGGSTLGEVEEGRHYVYGRAFSDGCDVVGVGCTDTDVGPMAADTGEVVDVQLDAVVGPRCGSGCDASCAPVGRACGDGVLALEICDDGNTMAGDGCDPLCRTEPGFVCNEAEPSGCRGF